MMCVDTTAEWLQRIKNAQPLLFAIQTGIVQLLLERSLRFDICYGHSVGEVATAYATGALSMEQTVRVIKVCSRAQVLAADKDRMAVADMGEGAARELIAVSGLDNVLEVADANSPGTITLASPLTALETVQVHLAQADQLFQMLGLDYAFHGRQVDATHDVMLEGP